MDIELFTTFFREGLDRVSDIYYGNEEWKNARLQDWNIGPDHPKHKDLEAFLWRNGERAFCYELYYEVRKLMDEHWGKHPPRQDDPPIYFQAELQKQHIHDVIEHFPEIEQGLEKKYIPDFLLHSPYAGYFGDQMVIVEVKAAPDLSFSDIADDLSKIQQFINQWC